MRIVADIGGTNTRLAFAQGGQVLAESITSHRNDDLTDFTSALREFQGGRTVSGVVVAVAGPVEPDRARLTNRDWEITLDDLRAASGAPACLLNDLTALGMSVPALGAAQLRQVHPASPRGDQALVLGMGTGVNASPVLLGAPPRAMAVEMGHMALPCPVWQALEDEIGAQSGFGTFEDLFAGAGFWRLCQCYLALPGATPEQIAAAPGFAGAQKLHLRLTGLALRELALAYLPQAGIFLAGGVIRRLIEAVGGDEIARACAVPLHITEAPMPPVWLIEEDEAALRGAALLPLGADQA